MNKHTPGPWVYRGKSDAVYTPSTDPVYKYGSQIFRFHDEDGPNDADLDLVLAAPDLLDALQAISAYWDEVVPPSHMSDMHKAARAALQKATGVTQ